jgi:integrase
LAEFVGIKFLPEHIEQKSFAGRRHYQAMLKHILRPETVDQLFNPGVVQSKSRLKAIPAWPYVDKIKLCELREQHVKDLTEAAFAHGYSVQTVTHIRNVIGKIITHAKQEGLFAEKNPVSSVELPPICHERPQDLTIAQARAMLRMMQYPEREIALIAITTGMSIQEICGLQWKHVNLTRNVVDCDGDTIPPGFILLKQHWYPEGIVNLHSNRVRLIDVPQPLSLTLLRLKQEAASEDPDSFVLVTPSGAPVRPGSLCKIHLTAIGRKISLPWLSWQVVKRAHDAMLRELRVQLSTDLVSSAW